MVAPGHRLRRAARLVHCVPAVNRLHAHQHHVEGIIRLDLGIDARGNIVRILPPRSDEPDELVQAAMAAARQWRFEPAINRMHQAMDSWVRIPVGFQRSRR